MNPVGGGLRPKSIKRIGDGLTIDWSDGRLGRVSFQSLRANCPCATCRDEREKPPDPFRILTDKDLAGPTTLEPVAMSPIGYYAYKVVWNDGHDAGIFTVENLRELCEPTTEQP